MELDPISQQSWQKYIFLVAALIHLILVIGRLPGSAVPFAIRYWYFPPASHLRKIIFPIPQIATGW